ncbi:glycosyltransferase family 9 protein [Flavilitoribacter nigricans]|uniref:Glycosyl transferase n=1 Tax=Flavilitoribacter nigricans (strain ATCC 23147 / DSM 23189 / NBRC 102662 / NCIMB 1420 / SS-2) TaxID=1122177 RepID=A0A2D0NBN3_FLAN2|nr:glycosyltransferase family 9 protein [Flavilitoribacter nigricans]PHN05798.1 glycosyl transferase [Flavilitoribacter nigricans DSM 23189 = NBRC 102662]
MKKVLVIRFSSIGDIVLTSPVVRCLKQQAGAEVHFLTKAGFRSVVEPNPYIDRVFTIEKKVSEVLPALKAERYDFLFDLHQNLRSLQVKMALPGIRHYSFDKLNLEKWLLVQMKINQMPNLHIVDRYLQTTEILHIKNDGEGLDYFIPPADEVDTDALLRSGGTSVQLLPKNKKPDTAYVAFVIGAAHPTKRLPVDQIIDWCARINGPVILLGGPDDAERGRAIAEATGSHVVNACGKLRLHQSASVVRQARLVISHDTGLMHIAAAFRKPIWSVWGNTVPEFGMYPYYPEGMDRNRTFEVKGLKCRPCSKIGHASCPKGHFRCMQEIELEDVTLQLQP